MIKNNGGKKWEKEDIDYLKINMYKMTYNEIGKNIGRTKSSVKSMASKLGYNKIRKYNYDMKFFDEINSEEKAYWLGFIYADGYINDFSLMINLNRKDKEHLKKFNKSLNGNLTVRDYEAIPKNKKHNIVYGSNIQVNSVELLGGLKKHGVFSCKSCTIKFPKIDDKFIWSFLRGYFDGDGSMTIKNENYIFVHITSGSENFLISIMEILQSHNIKTRLHKISDTIFRIFPSGKKNTKIFLESIYENANIYLDRKYKFYCNNKHLLEYERFQYSTSK